MKSANKVQSGKSLVLPCACANLRRAARAATRLYNRELRETGLEVTQHTILMALEATGETTQGELGRILSLDSTTLTRMLAPLMSEGWVKDRPGEDRRRRLLCLTRAGKRKFRNAQAAWERAQAVLEAGVEERTWNHLGALLAEVAQAAGGE